MLVATNNVSLLASEVVARPASLLLTELYHLISLMGVRRRSMKQGGHSVLSAHSAASFT